MKEKTTCKILLFLLISTHKKNENAIPDLIMLTPYCIKKKEQYNIKRGSNNLLLKIE
jgi:hypothetical protein